MTSESHPKIIIDKRELNSNVVKSLERIGCDYELSVLEVGDYILSSKIAVERKTTKDFLSTWLDRHELFGQLIDLARSYDRPLLIVEGIPEELYTLRRINPKSVEAILDTITASLRIPIIYTLNSAETAQRLYHIAERVQDADKGARNFNRHGKRSHMNIDEQREYTLSSISDLGITTARSLLKHFGSIQNVINADKEQLMEVENVGIKTAEKIKEVTGGAYGNNQKS